jgi:hypothetical protein
MGYQPATTREIVADPDNPTIEFRLPPGKRLRGRVVDPRGNPIAAAQIFIPVTSPHKGISFNKRTDAHGRFEWDSAPAEPVMFVIGAKGYLSANPIRLTASDKVAVITLRPAVDVRLEVVDAETAQPIPEFRVAIGTPVPGTKDIRWGRPIGATSQRSYREALDAETGPYQFKITADGYAPAQIVVPGGRMILREIIKLKKVPGERAPNGSENPPKNTSTGSAERR